MSTAMRAAVVAFLGAVLMVGLIVLYKSKSGAGAGNSQTTGAASEADGSPGEAGANAPPLTAEELALTELRDEIGKAEPVAYRSDEQRLEDARAWVAANRPADRPYNEIEAKILALMDVLVDGDKRSAEWVMNMSQIEVEMIRAIDADGDGQVSDDEVQRFIDDRIGAMFNPMEHPYLQEKFDADGDGTVSPEEMAGFASVMSDGALSGAFERGKLEAWDADDDGFVSESERVAGLEAATAEVEEMYSQFMPEMDTSEMPEEMRETVEAEIAKQMEAMQEQINAAKDMMVSQAVSQDLLEAMRLDNLPSPDPQEIMGEMPKPPDPLSFDLDHDGNMTDEESAAQTEAMLAYQEEIQTWTAELTAYRLKEQFDHATTQHDSDADGRMSADEWELRIDDLLDERDERLLLRNYDTDESGRVEASELTTFLDWYRAGSLRADINYDGSLDGRDLEQMARAFQSQEN